MSNRKVHIGANKAHTLALCASRPGAIGKVRPNSRTTYKVMDSEIVSMRKAATLPHEVLCAHCANNALQFRNKMRKDRGLKPVSDWRVYED